MNLSPLSPRHSFPSFLPIFEPEVNSPTSNAMLPAQSTYLIPSPSYSGTLAVQQAADPANTSQTGEFGQHHLVLSNHLDGGHDDECMTLFTHGCDWASELEHALLSMTAELRARCREFAAGLGKSKPLLNFPEDKRIFEYDWVDEYDPFVKAILETCLFHDERCIASSIRKKTNAQGSYIIDVYHPTLLEAKYGLHPIPDTLLACVMILRISRDLKVDGDRMVDGIDGCWGDSSAAGVGSGYAPSQSEGHADMLSGLVREHVDVAIEDGKGRVRTVRLAVGSMFLVYGPQSWRALNPVDLTTMVIPCQLQKA